MNSEPSDALPLSAAHAPPTGRTGQRLRTLWPRWYLWLLLAGLVLALLMTVIWLARRHEIEQVQIALDRDAADAVADLRNGLQRNVQSLLTLQTGAVDPESWAQDAQDRLYEHREWLRLEWRDALLKLRASADTRYHMPLFGPGTRTENDQDMALACAAAQKFRSPAYSSSHYVVPPGGTGMEIMELCIPLDGNGYLVAVYSLRETLTELVRPTLRGGQEVSFAELDGTRLAAEGASRRAGSRVFTSRHLVDLPGFAMMLRIDGWRAEPDLFPNVLTGLVTAMSIALVSVLVLLTRDSRRRVLAERGLADALAFRKAMEDSVITGLRARDLTGRITYVNPAFCEMVGFSAEELIGSSGSGEVPYWPTELAHEYQQRQLSRLSDGQVPPREGFESVFMHRDGSRFPVLIFEAPLVNAQRVQTGWMTAILDLSEQRRIEELSRASQERLQASARLATVGEMASLLSHELTQPLAAIASYASGSLNLLEHDAAREDIGMALRRIAEQADRAGQVIRSVHDFVRRRDRTREVVPAQSLVDAILPLVSMQANKLGMRIKIHIEKNLPPMLCNRTLVEQVLLNLARNGMQAMDQPDIRHRLLVIRATAIRAQGEANEGRRWVMFSVTDHGIGISEEVAARLFTPFFTTRVDGMGLGLSLCRTVVEQHGGHLDYVAHHPRGTLFRFTLPAA